MTKIFAMTITMTMTMTNIDDGDVEAGGKYISWNDGERETEHEDLVFEAMHVQIQLQIQI